MSSRYTEIQASISKDTASTFVSWQNDGQRIHFLMASSLYHPDTVERSLETMTASGGEPGLKDPERNWDLRPHRETDR